MPRKKRREISPAIKAKIFSLKEEGKSNSEIGRELGVSRQYVSYLLISTGWQKGSDTSKTLGTLKDYSESAQAAISRLEKQGEYGLDEMLRVREQRRTKDDEDGQ